MAVIFSLASIDNFPLAHSVYTDKVFDPYMYMCVMKFLEGQSLLALSWAIWCIIIPGLLICSTNIYMIYKAARLMNSHGRNVKGTVTVILMCGAFLLSYIPFCIALGMSFMNSGERGLEFTLSNSSLGINVIINPLIYTFTNNRFCTFMKSMIGIEPAPCVSVSSARIQVTDVSSDTRATS